MTEYLLGLDLGGTNVRAALVTVEGKILAHHEQRTKAGAGPAVVIDQLAESARAAVDEAGVEWSAVVAAGAGAPGPMNWKTGIVYSPPNLKGWRDVPLAEELKKRLDVPCFVDNDANLACFGEFWTGAGRDVDDMCMLTLGTGVGGGIVVHGQLLRGKDGTAAEIGHMKVTRGGRTCGCGATGCLEAYASVTGLVRTAQEGLAEDTETTLYERCNNDLTKLTGKMISEAANEGDAFAKWAMEETGIWLGVGLSSLINLLNPEMIILGGGMIAAGDALFSPVRETAVRLSFDVPAKRCRIIPAELGADAGVIGAAGAAHDRLKRER